VHHLSTPSSNPSKVNEQILLYRLSLLYQFVGLVEYQMIWSGPGTLRARESMLDLPSIRLFAMDL
jgi:hypothetical protein